PPFPEGTPLQKLLDHQERPPQPLTELRADLPPGLEAVLQRMLAKDPALRLQTPAEVAEALAPFCQVQSILRPRAAGRRRGYARAAVAAVAAVLLAAGCWLAFSLAWRTPGESGTDTASAGEGRPIEAAGRGTGDEVRCFGGQAGPFTAVAFAADG